MALYRFRPLTLSLGCRLIFVDLAVRDRGRDYHLVLRGASTFRAALGDRLPTVSRADPVPVEQMAQAPHVLTGAYRSQHMCFHGQVDSALNGRFGQ